VWGNLLTIQCEKSQELLAKCANFGEVHTANYKGCLKYPRKIVSPPPTRQRPTEMQPVTPTISFAVMVGQPYALQPAQQRRPIAPNPMGEILAPLATALETFLRAINNLTTANGC
jgi:hypothetical protein